MTLAGARIWSLCGLLSLGALAWAQTAAPSTLAGERPTAKTGKPQIDAPPAWTDLNERQKAALSPLKKMWPEINQAQKRKWLAVSHNYHDLPEQEQQKMHARMRDWVRLAPRERALARLEYARAQTLSVDERRNRWEAYQALTETERQQLAQQHPPRPAKGAAIALRPVPTAKISPPPAASKAREPGQGFSALRIDTDQIHPVTLLPLNVPGHASP
jgi:hypothetical protein